jgi:nicotinate-nucleotide pyrophosphorylase (carboxylating)
MLDLPSFRAIVSRALVEDLGRGDITTDACVSFEKAGKAYLRARERLVFCGFPVVKEVFTQLDPRVRLASHIDEGEMLSSGGLALSLEGPARSLLKGERLSLNFAQRMSGIATLTRSYVDALSPGAPTKIVDTRKTSPGLRVLERYAVRCGGGYNHRSDLSAAILIKDNHVAAAGSITQAIDRARRDATHCTLITCEVDSMQQLSEALEARADVVLLDNFSDIQIADAMRTVGGRAKVEVSGAMTQSRVKQISALGVDVISVGALTHSARAVDLGLDWDLNE